MEGQIISDILCNVKNKMKEYFYLKEETYTQKQVNDKESALNTKIDNKSKVKFTSKLNNGTPIGIIDIDNNKTTIYCEHNTDTTYTPASSTPLADSGNGNVGASTKYAREDHVHPTDKSKVTFSPTLTSGIKIGTINIDGTNKDLYCEKNPDTYNASAIIDSNAHTNIGSNKNNTQSVINEKIDTALSNKAQKSHAVNADTYGKGTADVFGHVKIANNLTTTSTDSIALAAAQGKALKESINSHNHGSLLNNGTITTSSNTANKVVITDTNNAVKIIDKLPADKVTHQDISGKVDKVTGKGLSTNDLDNNRAEKLDSVYKGARAKKRPLGFIIESNIDTSNQPLILIKRNTQLKVHLYESENTGDIRVDKTGIVYPQQLQVKYMYINSDFIGPQEPKSLNTTGLPNAPTSFNVGLNPGIYIFTFSFDGTANFYPVYRTIFLKVIE